MVVPALERAAAVAQLRKTRAQHLQVVRRKFVRAVEQLERVDAQVVERDAAGGELAVEQIVRRVDGAQARVSVVVGVHANAERTLGPQRRRLPVIVVVTEI